MISEILLTLSGLYFLFLFARQIIYEILK